MDWIKPPTDNLYKFVFIAGLLVAGFAVYWRYKVAESMSALNGDFDKDYIELVVGHNTLLLPFASTVPFAQLPIEEEELDPCTADLAKERRKAIEKMNKMKDQLMCVAQPMPGATLKKRFQLPEIKKQIMQRNSLDEATYAKYVDEQKESDLEKNQALCAQQAIAGLVKWSTVRGELTDAFDQMTAYREAARESTFGIWVGLVFAAIGGTFWFLRVQRYQDRVLWMQTQPAEAKPSHNGRHVARPHASIRPR
jgi:hypothetical protein